MPASEASVGGRDRLVVSKSIDPQHGIRVVEVPISGGHASCSPSPHGSFARERSRTCWTALYPPSPEAARQQAP